MQASKTQLNIYVVLLLACALMGATTGGGFVLSLCRHTIFAWSFVYFFKTVANFQKEPAVIKALTIFYLSLAIYGIIGLVEGKTLQVGIHDVKEIVPLNYLYKTSWSLLPIFAFYQFAKKGLLTKQYMLKWLVAFIVVATISYNSEMHASMARHDGEESTNNAGYLIVSLVPMLIFLKYRSYKQYLFLGGAILLAFMSMKRGAILTGLVTVAIYFWYLFRNSKKSTKIEIFILLLIASFGVFSIFDRMEDTSERFRERVEDTMEGDTSGRDRLNDYFLEDYEDNYSVKEKLIGRGANSTVESFGMFAHNDWIELGINQGLLGILLYVFFWIAFVKLLLKKNVPPEVKTSLAMLFAIYFLMTFFSMSYSGYTLYASMALGYGIAVACDAGKARKKYLLGLK